MNREGTEEIRTDSIEDFRKEGLNMASVGMDSSALLERLFRAYSEYYDIDRQNPPEPFDASAVFEAKAEQYFLIRSARYHKCSDITLIVVAQSMAGGLDGKTVKRFRHSKSFKMGLWGVARYRLAVLDAAEERAYYNWQGRALSTHIGKLFTASHDSHL